MTDAANPRMVTPIPAGWVVRMLATASRAPSVHNTQPWRFSVSEHAIELYADPARKIHHDPIGRQMLISCGAALFGLRLAVRELGRVPAVTLFPKPARPALLARVALGPKAPLTDLERRMLAALPHRHTHRGAFDPVPLPAGLLAGLQHDALAEGATLSLVDGPGSYAQTGRARGRGGEETGPRSRGLRRDHALEPPARQPQPGRCARERVPPGGRRRARPAGAA